MFKSEMPQEIRAAYLGIWAGMSPPHGITTRLHYLDSHFPKAKLPYALNWLIRNKLIGQRFIDWVDFDCVGSNLEMMRRLMAAVEREKVLRPLTAEKDLAP
jgi:hypothetical protein